MIIGMTVGAFRVRNGRLEIAARMAIRAGHGAVFADKREISFRMIKPFQLRHARPVSCVVAGLAGAFECSLVGIGVAI